jgi:hypothetical protein
MAIILKITYHSLLFHVCAEYLYIFRVNECMIRLLKIMHVEQVVLACTHCNTMKITSFFILFLCCLLRSQNSDLKLYRCNFEDHWIEAQNCWQTFHAMTLSHKCSRKQLFQWLTNIIYQVCWVFVINSCIFSLCTVPGTKIISACHW